jgi:hypothetical protein
VNWIKQVSARVQQLFNVRLVRVEVSQVVGEGEASLGCYIRAVGEADYIEDVRSLWRKTLCYRQLILQLQVSFCKRGAQ